jgi:hypothetical protein
MRRPALYVAAGSAALLLLAALAWLMLQGSGGVGGGPRATATNPALDARYTYDSAVFTPAPYDPNAEYPLRLDAEDFSFYGKRIRGLGTMLGKDPGSLLYDFVGSEHNAEYETWYRLKPVEPPVYEDTQLQRGLALHSRLAFERTADSRPWPAWFPAQYQSASTAPPRAYIESWALFTDRDLWFFTVVSPEPLTARQRGLSESVINNAKFDALLGGATPQPDAPADPAPATGE